MRKLLMLAAAMALTGCTEVKTRPETAAAPQAQAQPQPTAGAENGLKIIDQKIGTGPEAVAGKTVSVQYTGWLEDGHKEFDSSFSRNRPFEFRLGAGQVIRGWDQGVVGMKVGGKRSLVIPAGLGYGQDGAGKGLIPPGATLLFDVELLEVK